MNGENIKKLNFSCGGDIRSGWDNCDWQETDDVRVIFCDANTFPYSFKDDTYDYILLKQCLNFYENPRWVLLELWRIAKDKGIIAIEVPYFNNKGAFTDMDSKRFFHEQSFITFVEDNCRIEKKNNFEIAHLYLEPTRVGKFFPVSLRKKLSLFIGGLIGKMYIKLRIKKTWCFTTP